MERPVTSKARGVCQYYPTAGGCFEGDRCKFLHYNPKTDTELPKHTPYDLAKKCKFYANGFCKKGDKCWFRHEAPKATDGTSDKDLDEDNCSICLEAPQLYGLLDGCSHVFCIECIRKWRESHGTDGDVSSGVHKKCPMCRSTSKFVTPSSIYYKEGQPEKTKAIAAYKGSMARVPCKYFQSSRHGGGSCRFGKDCFYQHVRSGPSTMHTAESRQGMDTGNLPYMLPAHASLQDEPAPQIQHLDMEVWLQAFRRALASGNGVEAVAALRDAAMAMDSTLRRASNRDSPLSDQELHLFNLLMDSIRRVADVQAEAEEEQEESNSETGLTDYESAASSPRNAVPTGPVLPEDQWESADREEVDRHTGDTPPPFVTDGRGRVIGAYSEAVEDVQEETLMNRVINVFSNIL